MSLQDFHLLILQIPLVLPPVPPLIKNGLNDLCAHRDFVAVPTPVVINCVLRILFAERALNIPVNVQINIK